MSRKLAKKAGHIIAANTVILGAALAISQYVLEKIAKIAIEHDLFIISDELYEDMWYSRLYRVMPLVNTGKDIYVFHLLPQ